MSHVDSKHQQLSTEEIISIAATKAKPAVSPEQMRAVVLALVHQAGAKIIREGNTLFVLAVSKEQPDTALFFVVNADSDENEIKNFKGFMKAVNSMKIVNLVTTFRDKDYVKDFNALRKNPPVKGMAFELKLKDDRYVAYFKFNGNAQAPGLSAVQ